MSLPRAYCIETNQVVDITTARIIFFSQNEPRKSLSFLCAHSGCRDGNKKPIVLGINYNKNPAIESFKQQPHFRTKQNNFHEEDCPFADYQIAVDEYNSENKIEPEIKGIKKSELIQVFEPIELEEKDIDNSDISILDAIKNIKNKSERICSIKEYLKKSTNHTSRLTEAVKCYEAMENENRKLYPFSIKGYETKSYAYYFKYSKYCHPKMNERIYYGRVSVNLVSNAEKKFYALKFHMNSIGFRDEDKNERQVTVIINKEVIHDCRDRAYYQAILESMDGKSGNMAMCYVYGKPVFSKNNPDKKIYIVLNHMKNLDISIN